MSIQRIGRLRRLPGLAIILLIPLLIPIRAHAADAESSQITTHYFTITYPSEAAGTAELIAGFVDGLDESISDLLGFDPQSGLTVHIYRSASERTKAQTERPVGTTLAELLPQARAIDVAADEIQAASASEIRQAFRNALTQLIVRKGTNDNLAYTLQVGLAEYNELSPTNGKNVLTILTSPGVFFNDQGVLTTFDLELSSSTESQTLSIAESTAYLMIASLLDHYGWPAFRRYLALQAQNSSWNSDFVAIYGATPDKLLGNPLYGYLNLEFNKGGNWQHNLLAAYDIDAGRDLFQAGQFTPAHNHFLTAAGLWQTLGSARQFAAASTAAQQAMQAAGAAQQAQTARTALEAHQYTAAQAEATQARTTFSMLPLTDYAQQAGATADLAAQGLRAQAALGQARAHLSLPAFDLDRAQSEAQQAGTDFAALGDQDGVTQANALLDGIWQGQWVGGLAALGAAAVAGLLALLAWVRRRRTRVAPVALPLLQEQRSWM